MGRSISDLIRSLEDTVGERLNAIEVVVSEQSALFEVLSQEQKDFVQAMHTSSEQFRTASNETLWAKLDEQARMLDNIQRHKRPGQAGFKY